MPGESLKDGIAAHTHHGRGEAWIDLPLFCAEEDGISPLAFTGFELRVVCGGGQPGATDTGTLGGRAHPCLDGTYSAPA